MKIISQETIKPSSPTPPHLRTHVLSLADSIMPSMHLRFVFFYKSYNDDKINILKQSLSQCLTQYYPFAGRYLNPPASVIDCNDEGVEFVEAAHDNHLEDFIEISKNIHELIPIVSFTKFLHVQLNHFNGRGVALVISISHSLADGFAASTFISQWAKIARGEPSFKPNFFTSTTRYNNAKPFTLDEAQRVKLVGRSFVFPNSKISKLKNKIISMGLDQTDQTNAGPTRVEVLTSLLFKCMVDSATVNSGVFTAGLSYAVNMRKKLFKNDPERAVGNMLSLVVERFDDSSKIELNGIVSKLMKGKTIEEKDVSGIGENMEKAFKKLGAGGRMYSCSSFCWFPLYDVDFGWGKPVNVKYVGPDAGGSYFTLLDTPNKDGIEAIVYLPEEEMRIFQQNKELLLYVG